MVNEELRRSEGSHGPGNRFSITIMREFVNLRSVLEDDIHLPVGHRIPFRFDLGTVDGRRKGWNPPSENEQTARHSSFFPQGAAGSMISRHQKDPENGVNQSGWRICNIYHDGGYLPSWTDEVDIVENSFVLFRHDEMTRPYPRQA